MRKTILAALAAGTLLAPATANAAGYAAHKYAAYDRVTRDCIQYVGCNNIVLRGNSNGGGSCSTWAFTYDTRASRGVGRTVLVHDRVLCIFPGSYLNTYM